MTGATRSLVTAWNKFYCQIKGLPLYWQIVTLCAALIVLTIGATWVAADTLAEQYKSTLAARFGIEIQTAHEMFVASLHQSLAAAAILGLATTLVASLVFVPLILKPLKAMSVQADKVAAGDFGVRVDLASVPESCEVHALGGAFNRMAEQLERQHTTRRRILADLSHDLITPLTNLKGYFEGISEQVVTPSSTIYAMLTGEVSRLIRLVMDLRQLSEAEVAKSDLDRRPIVVDNLFRSAVELIAVELAQKNVTVRTSIAPDADSVWVDHDKIARVLRNILHNAAFFAHPNTTLDLSSQRAGNWIVLRIANTGDRLEPRHIPHLFDRFYRADPARSRSGGAGLGLAIAKELVEAHGGTIEVTAQGRETAFEVRLPIVMTS